MWSQAIVGDKGEVCVSLQGGAGARIWRIPDSYDLGTFEYLSKRRFGLSLSGDVSYTLKSGFGLGIRFSSLASSKEALVDIKQQDGTFVTDIASNRITIDYFGPFVSVPFYGQTSSCGFYFNVGVGVLLYYDNSRISEKKIVGRGITSGTYIGLGYNIKLNNSLSINFELSGIGGFLKSLNREENNSKDRLDLPIPEWLLHFSVNAGVKCYFH